MSRRHLFLVVMTALLSLTSVACGAKTNAATITLNEFTIKPKGVLATAGSPMTMTLINSGKIEHNLELEAKVSDVTALAVLKPGESKTVTFTPKMAGSFQFVCTIPGHAPAGMVGTLTVNP